MLLRFEEPENKVFNPWTVAGELVLVGLNDERNIVNEFFRWDEHKSS